MDLILSSVRHFKHSLRLYTGQCMCKCTCKFKLVVFSITLFVIKRNQRRGVVKGWIKMLFWDENQ